MGCRINIFHSHGLPVNYAYLHQVPYGVSLTYFLARFVRAERSYLTLVFIRAKRRRLAGSTTDGSGRWQWDFQLVRSVRVDGQPRQRIIAYLGTCADFKSDAPDMILAREAFYKKMLPTLEGNGFKCSKKNLLAVTKLAPRPSLQELRCAEAQIRAFLNTAPKCHRTSQGMNFDASVVPMIFTPP